MSIQLSVVIITLNEEKNIGRCLDSIQGIADDIVVLDSGSVDQTASICKRYSNVRFINQPWLGGFAEQKNAGNQLTQHNYILSLDGDESLSQELAHSIAAFKRNPTADVCIMNRLTNYCGQWIHHSGWYPDRKMRLWNKTKGYWQGTIHEELIMNKDSKKIQLHGDILHYSFYSINDHLKKIQFFTDQVAQADFIKKKRSTLLKIIVSPCAKFFKDYILHSGFKDGYYGFLICALSAYATFIKYIKLRELQKNRVNKNNEVIS